MERPEYERMYQVEDSHWWFVGRRQLALTLLDGWVRFKQRPRILDIGCGTGGNLAYLSRWGQGAGLDLSAVALEYARRRDLPGLAQASSLALPYGDDTFEVVTLFDILYHRWVVNDDQAIYEAYRVLKPGGWLLVTDSALPSLWSIHDEIYYARQRYTLELLKDKLTQIGFEGGVFSYTNTLLLPIFVVERLLTRWFRIAGDDVQALPGWLNTLLLGARNLETAWLRRGKCLPLGSSLICLTQKPDNLSAAKKQNDGGNIHLSLASTQPVEMVALVD